MYTHWPEIMRHRHAPVYVGQRFGEWTVSSAILGGRSGLRSVLVKCSCFRATERYVIARNLFNGLSQSCHHMAKGSGAFVPIGPSIAYVPLTKGLFSVVEVDDISKIDSIKWAASKGKDRSGENEVYYARCNRKGLPRNMHALLLAPRPGFVADHKNGNTLDNRRHGNLREATLAQNNRNRRTRHDSTLGLKWTFLRKESGKYRSQLSLHGKKINCGDHATAQAAHEAAAAKAKELHGEFARLA